MLPSSRCAPRFKGKFIGGGLNGEWNHYGGCKGHLSSCGFAYAVATDNIVEAVEPSVVAPGTTVKIVARFEGKLEAPRILLDRGPGFDPVFCETHSNEEDERPDQPP